MDKQAQVKLIPCLAKALTKSRKVLEYRILTVFSVKKQVKWPHWRTSITLKSEVLFLDVSLTFSIRLLMMKSKCPFTVVLYKFITKSCLICCRIRVRRIHCKSERTSCRGYMLRGSVNLWCKMRKIVFCCLRKERRIEPQDRLR